MISQKLQLTSSHHSGYAYGMVDAGSGILHAARKDTGDSNNYIELRSYVYNSGAPDSAASKSSGHLKGSSNKKLATSRGPELAMLGSDLYVAFRENDSDGDDEPIYMAQIPLSAINPTGSPSYNVSSSQNFSAINKTNYTGDGESSDLQEHDKEATTDATPAMIVFNGELVMAYKTNRHTIGFGWGSGSNWLTWNNDVQFLKETDDFDSHGHHRDYKQGAKMLSTASDDLRNNYAHSERAPSLAVVPGTNQLMIAYKDNHNSDPKSQPILTALCSDVPNASWTTGTDGETYGHVDSAPGTLIKFGDGSSPITYNSGPALGVYNNTLYMAWVEGDGEKDHSSHNFTLSLASYSNGSWSKIDLKNDSGQDIQPDDASPELIEYHSQDGQAYLAISYVQGGKAVIDLFQ